MKQLWPMDSYWLSSWQHIANVSQMTTISEKSSFTTNIEFILVRSSRLDQCYSHLIQDIQ